MQLASFVHKVQDYLASRNPELENGDLDPSQNLIKSGIIDSFGFADLLIFLEDLFERQIPFEDIHIDNLDTLEKIYSMFTREPIP